MVRIILQVLLVLGVLWFQRRNRYHPRPLTLAVIWYALGVPLMLLESKIALGVFFTDLTLQSMLIALFFVPPAYFAFRRAHLVRKGISKPFLLYLALAVVATVLAALILARAQIVQGLAKTVDPY